jgi:hypothetical protein
MDFGECFMKFEEFYKLFQSALNIAIKNAEDQLQRALPSNLMVVLHGAGHSGDLMDSLTAAKALYLGETKFYRIIDVSVIKVSGSMCTLFVRASSHAPASFDKTWNNPPGSGPFKQLFSTKIEIEDLGKE